MYTEKCIQKKTSNKKKTSGNTGGDVTGLYFYSFAPRVGGIKRWFASDVCPSRTSGLIREQRPKED